MVGDLQGSELPKILRQLQNAKHPEDAFGCVPGETKDAVESRYKKIARVVHPDRHHSASETIKKMASDAMALAGGFWEKAERKFEQGRWGQKDSGVSIQATKLYTNVTELAAGDISDVYLAEMQGGPRAVIKVGYPQDVDLLQNEARILTKLWKPKDTSALFTQQFLPKLIEQTKVKIDGKERLANILEACELGFTLEQVKDQYKDGLDPRHVAWIWKRMVEAMTWVHDMGITHGAIVPSHIIVYPKNHGICILDWSYACTDDQVIKAIVSKYKDMYPKEVFKKLPARPTVDIYMMAQVAKYLLSNKSGEVPSHVPPVFNAMIRAYSLPAFHRTNSLREVHDQLTDNLRKVYGPRKFVELEM